MCRECGCGPHHHVEGGVHIRRRRFLTKAERAEKVKSYAEELRKELVAAEERIKELEA